jgi:hypothetical protein
MLPEIHPPRTPQRHHHHHHYQQQQQRQEQQDHQQQQQQQRWPQPYAQQAASPGRKQWERPPQLEVLRMKETLRARGLSDLQGSDGVDSAEAHRQQQQQQQQNARSVFVACTSLAALSPSFFFGSFLFFFSFFFSFLFFLFA